MKKVIFLGFTILVFLSATSGQTPMNKNSVDGEKYVIKFRSGCTTVNPCSCKDYPELMQIVEALENNPQSSIQIRSYSFKEGAKCRGNACKSVAADANRKSSNEKRADALCCFFVSNGFDKSRISQQNEVIEGKGDKITYNMARKARVSIQLKY